MKNLYRTLSRVCSYIPFQGHLIPHSVPHFVETGRSRIQFAAKLPPPGVLGQALSVFTAALALVLTVAGPASAAETQIDLTPPTEGTRVLIVTGIDYPGHHWQETAPALKALLEKDPRFKVRVVEDPNTLASPQLQKWDVVILHFMNWEKPSPGEEARQNLLRFVESGKGLMLTHFACGAWQDWPKFKELVGRVYDPKARPHDPYGAFRVDIADPQHPITKGMKPFETVDELYTCLTGDAPIHIVAAARSKVDGKDYPMAFVLNYGKGRVFHTVLGHDVRAFTNSSVPELLRRACAWAASLPVKAVDEK